MKREDILKVYEAGPEAVVQLVESLWAHIQQLDARVKVLEAQLNKNSRNSGKPPSSDGFKKPNPKSLREKGAHPVGGQKGHPGHTRFFVNEPDHIELHRVTTCSCGHSLEQTPTVHHERRQVWDKPPLKLEVTEHYILLKLNAVRSVVLGIKRCFQRALLPPFNMGQAFNPCWFI